MALYKIYKSFNTFEDESWTALFHKMNPAWKISSSKLSARLLLDEIHKKI